MRHSRQGPSSSLARGRILPLLALLVFCQAWGCQAWRSKAVDLWRNMPITKAWRVEKGLKKVRLEILDAEGLGMEEAALYHLTVARGLFEAARKQYEDADFTAAARFLDQSEQQLDHARRLHGLRRPRLDPSVGGPG